MKKLALFFSSILGGISGLFAQDYWPTIEVPDSLNPFLAFPNNAVEIADIDDDGFEDVLFYDQNTLAYTHLKGLGNGEFEEIPNEQSILNEVINAALNYFPDSVNWANQVGDWKIRFADIDNLGDTDIMLWGRLRDTHATYGNYMCENCDGDEEAQINYLVFSKNSSGDFNIESDQINVLPPSCDREWIEFADFDLDGDMDIIKSEYKSYSKYCNPQSSMTFFQYDENTSDFVFFDSLENYIPNPDANSPYNEQLLWFNNRYKFYDFNQDGFEDIWEGRNIWLRNGQSISSPVLNNYNEKIELVNPNLFPDVIPSIEFSFFLNKTDFGDFDNDGFLEWVFYDNDLEKWRVFTQKCSESNVGQYCVDFDICTEEESFNENCNCIGEFLDDDMDGVCNAFDQCPGENDLQDYNMNNIPDCLEIQSDADFEDNGIGPAPNVSNKKSLIADEVKIFPNPSDGIFTIDSKRKIQHLKLFNAIGEEVPVFISGQNQIDLSHLPKGMYTLEFTVENSTVQKKIILQ